jgi:hypothetical protein
VRWYFDMYPLALRACCVPTGSVHARKGIVHVGATVVRVGSAIVHVGLIIVRIGDRRA